VESGLWLEASVTENYLLQLQEEVVPEAGFEPARGLKPRQILSLVRLPYMNIVTHCQEQQVKENG